MKSTKPIPDRAYRGTRISWKEFYKQRPDLRPANDDEPGARDTQRGAGGDGRLSGIQELSVPKACPRPSVAL